jgi:hypothetical protein
LAKSKQNSSHIYLVLLFMHVTIFKPGLLTASNKAMQSPKNRKTCFFGSEYVKQNSEFRPAFRMDK